MTQGIISGLKRFEIHDGDGIRTTVFLKGFPLRCVRCHNPENLSSRPELMYFQDKCIGCQLCAAVCGNHSFSGKIHTIHRETCVSCGKCAQVCPANALSVAGEAITPQALLPRLLEDRMFFDASGGGVTLSGGEPLAQPEFATEVLRLLKAEGIHTALDTCLFASRKTLEGVLPWTDLFLVDIKAMDSGLHQRCTGVPNGPILENIRYLDQTGASMEARIPFVPGWNADQIGPIADFLASLRHPPKVKLLPYHDYGNAKLERLGKEITKITPPDPAQIRSALSILHQRGLDAVNGAAL